MPESTSNAFGPDSDGRCGTAGCPGLAETLVAGADGSMLLVCQRCADLLTGQRTEPLPRLEAEDGSEDGSEDAVPPSAPSARGPSVPDAGPARRGAAAVNLPSEPRAKGPSDRRRPDSDDAGDGDGDEAGVRQEWWRYVVAAVVRLAVVVVLLGAVAVLLAWAPGEGGWVAVVLGVPVTWRALRVALPSNQSGR